MLVHPATLLGPWIVASHLLLAIEPVSYGGGCTFDAQEVVAVVTDELRWVLREYGIAFATVLALAKQRGLDCLTVERWVHALTIEGQVLPTDADHMSAALQMAAQAFRNVVAMAHRVGVTAAA